VDYAEVPPPGSLAAIVRCIWTLEGHARDLRDEAQPVLPDGCPELIVHLGDPFERLHPGGAVERQPAVIVAGQLTSQLMLRATARIAVVGVRFHPDGIAALLNMSQHELAGLTVGVNDVSPALFRSLNEVRSETAAPATAVAGVVDRLAAHARPGVDDGIDARVRRAVQAIERCGGLTTIDRLAGDIGLTRRHLERRFQRVVGISPKRLARITRFQRALGMLEQPATPRRGTWTAVECGYADQAHFVREFRELAGCAPGAHLLRNAELSGFFVRRPLRRL
jgi:AraC-like DNA-binding protein